MSSFYGHLTYTDLVFDLTRNLVSQNRKTFVCVKIAPSLYTNTLWILKFNISKKVINENEITGLFLLFHYIDIENLPEFLWSPETVKKF